jgi:hypothetical protein
MAKFYEGQEVRIINCTCGHGLDIDDVVTLSSVELLPDGSWDLWADEWIFDQDDCEPVVDAE